MAITSEEVRVVHTANGSTTFFSYAPIQGITAENIRVWLLNPADGSATQQTLDGDFTLSPSGITFANPPPNGHAVVIFREVPATQPDVYLTNAPFPAKVTERRLDKIVMALQEVRDAVSNRSVRAPLVDKPASLVLPPADQRANSLLRFDAQGNVSVVSTSAIPEYIPVSGFIETLLDDPDAATARNTLNAVARSGDTMTGPLSVAAGVSGGLRVAGDSDTQIVQSAADAWQIRTGGAARLTVTNSAVSASAQMLLDPTAGLAFSGDTDTRVVRPAEDSVVIQTGGVTRITIDNSGVTVASNPTNAMHVATKQYVDQAAGGTGRRLRAIKVFTSSGTWTAETGTTAILVQCVGGGGGGGKGSNNVGGGP